MSQDASPALERPHLPLRGRGKHVPSKRNFTFPTSWKFNKSGSYEKFAKISETEDGRGKIIEPSGGAFLARHVHESPVPVIISSAGEGVGEEYEVDEYNEPQKDGGGREAGGSDKLSPTSISGRVTLNKDGEILLTPSPTNRKRKRGSVKTFEAHESSSPPRGSEIQEGRRETSPSKPSPARRSPRLAPSPVTNRASRSSPRPPDPDQSKTNSVSKTSVAAASKTADRQPPSKKLRPTPAETTPPRMSPRTRKSIHDNASTPSRTSTTEIGQKSSSKPSEKTSQEGPPLSQTKMVKPSRLPVRKSNRTPVSTRKRAADDDNHGAQKPADNRKDNVGSSPPSPRKRIPPEPKQPQGENDETSGENSNRNAAVRKSPRKSLARSRVAKSPIHSALMEEEDEGAAALPAIETNTSAKGQPVNRRTNTRRSIAARNKEQVEEQSVEDNTEGLPNASQMFDEHIEGGHFASRADRKLSLTSRSMRVPHFESFNVSHPDYKLQRHSTPIPRGKRGNAAANESPTLPKTSGKVGKQSGSDRRKDKDHSDEGSDVQTEDPKSTEPVDNDLEGHEAAGGGDLVVDKPDSVREVEQEEEEGGSTGEVEEQVEAVEEAGEEPEQEARPPVDKINSSSTPKYTPSKRTIGRRSLFPTEENKTQRRKSAKTNATVDGADDTPSTTTPAAQGKKRTAAQRKPSSAKRKPTPKAAKNQKDISSFMSATGTSLQVSTPQEPARMPPPPRKKIVIPEPEVSMAERPPDVRIWQDQESLRTFSDINDLDVILERLEERAWDVRESMMDPFSRAVITKYMTKVQRDIRDAISESHRVTRLTSCISKLGTQIKAKRILLIECQQEKASLNAKIAELKKRQVSPMRCPKSMKDISDFLDKLSHLREDCDSSLKGKVSTEFVTYGGTEDSEESPKVRRSLQFEEN